MLYSFGIWFLHDQIMFAKLEILLWSLHCHLCSWGKKAREGRLCQLLTCHLVWDGGRAPAAARGQLLHARNSWDGRTLDVSGACSPGLPLPYLANCYRGLHFQCLFRFSPPCISMVMHCILGLWFVFFCHSLSGSLCTGTDPFWRVGCAWVVASPVWGLP